MSTPVELDVEPSCPADLDGDGLVGVMDLLAVVAGWGQAEADIDGDGHASVSDLLLVLANWGLCQDE